jgi:hypothetical protein
MGKRPPGAGTAVAAADSGAPAVGGDGDAAAAPTAPSTAAAPPAAQPEPFAREAKWFSEQRALGREVGAGGGGGGMEPRKGWLAAAPSAPARLVPPRPPCLPRRA